MVLDKFDRDNDMLIFKNTYNDPENGQTKKFEIARTDPKAPEELYFVHIEVKDIIRNTLDKMLQKIRRDTGDYESDSDEWSDIETLEDIPGHSGYFRYRSRFARNSESDSDERSENETPKDVPDQHRLRLGSVPKRSGAIIVRDKLKNNQRDAGDSQSDSDEWSDCYSPLKF